MAAEAGEWCRLRVRGKSLVLFSLFNLYFIELEIDLHNSNNIRSGDSLMMNSLLDLDEGFATRRDEDGGWDAMRWRVCLPVDEVRRKAKSDLWIFSWRRREVYNLMREEQRERQREIEKSQFFSFFRTFSSFQVRREREGKKKGGRGWEKKTWKKAGKKDSGETGRKTARSQNLATKSLSFSLTATHFCYLWYFATCSLQPQDWSYWSLCRPWWPMRWREVQRMSRSRRERESQGQVLENGLRRGGKRRRGSRLFSFPHSLEKLYNLILSELQRKSLQTAAQTS